jgi:hypothetical protein
VFQWTIAAATRLSRMPGSSQARAHREVDVARQRRAWTEIIQDRATPQAAAEKAFKRVEEIFAKFPITQT